MTRSDRRISMRLIAVLAGTCALSGRVTDVAFRGRGYEHAIDIDGSTRLTGVFADVRAATGDRARRRPGRPGGDDVRRPAAWRVDLPALVQAAPVVVQGSLLVQAADPGYACPTARAAVPAA